MTKQSDQAIFLELKQGSGTAFKNVYQSNRDAFINYSKKFGLDKQEVLDVYQDAYIAFYENIKTGKLSELKCSITTYITSIGKYMIMDRLRKQKKMVNSEFALEKVGENAFEITDFDITPNQPSERQLQMQRQFEKLGEKCRQILIWFYYNKMSIKEIMAQGDYNSENVVKSQKSRCLKGLKTALLVK